jgi:hypothetical protein
MRIDAIVKDDGLVLKVAWVDGKLSGDDGALERLAVVDWSTMVPFPAGPPWSIENPYSFGSALEKTFDEIVSLKANPPLELLYGDVLPPR